MKRSLLLVAVLVFICSVANAQTSTKADFGIKLGANLNQISGKYWENGYKANLMGGLYLGVNSNRIGVQVEGLFTQSTYSMGKNFYSLYDTLYSDIKDSLKQGNFRVSQFNIPLLLNIKLFSRATIQLGAQYSGVVSVNDMDALLKDAKQLFKTGDMSGVIGLNLQLPARLNFGARYIVGFNNINNQDGKMNINDSWKQRSLQLHLGFSFF